MRKYIFIIRGYNDIDHFIPLLDYLLNKKKSIVYLYSSIHPVRLYPNENLEYLNKTYNVEVKYLLEGVDKGFVFRKLEFYFYKFIFQTEFYIILVILISGEAHKLTRSKANLFNNLQEVIE